MATTQIAVALKAIPSKKEDLRKAFEVLQSYSSSFASFTLQWKDLEDHISSIERSIDARLKDLESKSLSAPPPSPAPATAAEALEEPEAEPRPELKSFCAKMNGKGLTSYINKNSKDLKAIRRELNSAMRLAPDPAALVLDAVDGFFPSKTRGDKEVLTAIRRTSITLLERIQAIAPEIKPSVRERAKKLALEWKGKISENGDIALEAMGFLQLVTWYGLISEFKIDEVMDLLVFVSRRNHTVDLIKALGLVEKVPDLIQKLKNTGKTVDAVKLVYAFDLLEKHPPVPLLKGYLKESKTAAQELLKNGKNSSQSKHAATLKDLSALRSVVKAVEEYKLEGEFPCDNLRKRIAQLEHQQRTEKKKRTSTAADADADADASNSKNQQQSNKRPRPSTFSKSAPATSSAPAPAPAHVHPQMVHHPHQMGLMNQDTYLGYPRSYGLPTTESLYGGNHNLPSSYLHPSGSFVGSGLYDRPVTYGEYSLSTPYGSSHYP